MITQLIYPIGYGHPQTITVGGDDATYDFTMTFSASKLDELVVTGTGAPVAKKNEIVLAQFLQQN